MDDKRSLPSVKTVANELEKLLNKRRAKVTETLREDMSSVLALYLLGGPEQPEDDEEAAERIDRLWVRLRKFLDSGFADEIATDPIVETEQGTPEDWSEAARLISRYDERGGTWYVEKYSDNFPELQAEADHKIRKGVGSHTYFRKNFQKPICQALARLLLKAEEDHRNKIGVGQPEEESRLPTRRLAGVAGSVLLLAALAFAIASGGASEEQVLAPSDFSVSLRADLEEDSEAAAALGSNVDLGPADDLREIGFDATVRPIAGERGRVPSGLRLVVVVPRKSLTGTSLPTAYLEVAGTPVREAGQHASAAVTISSGQADRLGLDIPSDFRIQVKRSGSDRWEPPQLLSARWQTCSEQSCVLRLPLTRFTGETNEAVRVGFQTLAYGLAKDGPLLVMDMEQRHLGDRFARDGELRVSPGDRLLYSLYLANRGTEPGRNVVARLALPAGERLIPGSVRVATTDASTPFAVEDNLANGGVRYATFGVGSSARFMAIAEVRPELPMVDWMKSYWLVSSDETQGTRYFDSVRARAGS
jgi:uncharacterized repeat protein (TIGR01451 family)